MHGFTLRMYMHTFSFVVLSVQFSLGVWNHTVILPFNVHFLFTFLTQKFSAGQGSDKSGTQQSHCGDIL